MENSSLFDDLVKELNAAVQGSSNILSGLTRGGNAGATILVTLSNGEQIAALALARVDSGTCFALKTDKGQYYVLPSTTDVTKRVNVKNYRQSRKQDETVINADYKPKVGYVFSKKVSLKTVIVCGTGSDPSPPSGSFPIPPYFPGRWYPAPLGQTRALTFTYSLDSIDIASGTSGCGFSIPGNTSRSTSNVSSFTINFTESDYLSYRFTSGSSSTSNPSGSSSSFASGFS